MFGRLDIELSESFLSQLEGGQVEIMRFLKKPLLGLLVVAVNSNLLQDQGWDSTAQGNTPSQHRGLTQPLSIKVTFNYFITMILIPHPRHPLTNIKMINVLKCVWGTQNHCTQAKGTCEMRCTFDSFGRGQQQMILGENVSDDVYSTLCVETAENIAGEPSRSKYCTQ